MSETGAQVNQDHRKGLLLALAGFSVLSCGDALIKSTGGIWPAPAFAALRFVLAIPLLSAILLVSEGRGSFAVARPVVQFWRGFAIAASSSLFFASLFLMPLSQATAIIFISPVLTALFSAVFLKEPLHRRGWLATAIALAGVALVLRPDIAELGLFALIPVAAAAFFSMMMILNRRYAGSASALNMQWTMALAAAPLLIVATVLGHFSGMPALVVAMPDTSVIAKAAVVAVTASFSHWLIYRATAQSTAAFVAPAVYIQLPITLLIDALVFRHLPDVMAIGGAILIVGAGFVMLLGSGRPPATVDPVH